MRRPNVFVIGNSGMVYRLSSLLYALGSDVFAGTVNYWQFCEGSKLRKLWSIPLDWFKLSINLISCDILWISSASHHSRHAKLAVLISRVLRKKTVIDFYISHYETKVIDRKLYKKESKAAERLLKCERQALLSASRVVFLNEAERDYYCSIVGVDPISINTAIIPLVNERKATFAELPFFNGSRDYPVFAWWGREVGNPIHGIESLLKYFCEIEGRLELVMCVTSEIDEHKIKCMLRKLKCKSSKSRISIRHDLRMADGTLQDYICKNVDISVASMGCTKKASVVVPNKLVDALSMGVPVLTIESVGVTELIGNSWPILIRNNNLIEQVRKLKGSINDRAEINSICINLYESVFSIDSFSNKVFRLIDELK